MAERSTIFAASILASLGSGALGGFGASLLRPRPMMAPIRPELVMLRGSGDLPAGDKVFCAPPGAVLNLNPHARLGETKQVLDCSNGASTKPILIKPSLDSVIMGALPKDPDGSQPLTLDGQGVGFVRVPGHWQEF